MRQLQILFALAVGMAPRISMAADWYVDASAAANGDGSQAKPFQTINASLGALNRGDTVWIATGTYNETVDVAKIPGTSGQTTFRALPNSTPIIDGTNGSGTAGFVLQSEIPDVTFQDLTIQNSAALAIQFYYADGGQVLNCKTTNIAQNAVNFYYSNQGLVKGCKLQGDIGGRKTTGTVVESNEVYGSSAEGIGLYDGSINCVVAHNVIHDNYSVNLYLDSVSHSIYDGNLIYESDPNNDLEGIEISDEGHYSDLAAPVNSYNTITNNIIVGHNLGIVFWYSDEWSTQALNDQSGLRYDVISNNTLLNNKGSFKWDASPAHVGTTIQNNIVVAQAGTSPVYALQAKSANGITMDHNLWYLPDLPQAFLWLGNQTDHAGFVSASSLGGGDVLADPMFVAAWVAPMATNLEVTSGSPAIGAGATLEAITDDFLGAPRPSIGPYDIGAFQYGAVAPSDGGFVPPAVDGGTSSDGGTTPPSSASGGCNCKVAANKRDGHGGLTLIALFAFVLRRSRITRFKRLRASFSRFRVWSSFGSRLRDHF